MSRTEARAAALAALYAAEQRHGQERDPSSSSGLSGRALRLAEEVWRHRDELDATLEGVSEAWRVERMPPVDRTILRIGLYELRYHPGTPTAVIINEAVELAKRYSTEHSGRFVNGVLGRLAVLERGDAAVAQE